MTPFEAERTVLGAMMHSEEAADIGIQRLRVDDFEDAGNRAMFTAMFRIHTKNRKVDLATLDSELTDRGELMLVGGAKALAETMNFAPGGSNASAYVDIVLENANKRRLRKLGEDIVKAVDENLNSADHIIEQTENVCNELGTRGLVRNRGWVLGEQMALMSYGAVEHPPTPIPTGFAELDEILCGGFIKSELTIAGARPGKGKSAFLLACALNAVRQGLHVGYFSLEMSTIQLGQRVLAADSLVSVSKQRKGNLSVEEWGDLADALTNVGNNGVGDHLHIYECYGMTIERLSNIARHAAKRGELDVLVVDYLQLLQTSQRSCMEWERLGIVSKGLKQLALSLDIPVLTAAQVRRPSQDDAKNGGRAPTMDELRGSGDLEQDADNVLLIHKPESPDDAVFNRIDPKHRNIWKNASGKMAKPFMVEVAKQRQGDTGRAWCLFQSMNMRFLEDKAV